MNPFYSSLLNLGLTQAQTEKIASIFSEELLIEKNGFFLREGSICRSVGFIAEGMVRYFYTVEKGEEITRWIGLPGDYITSLSSFITQTPSHENIQAIKPSRIVFTSFEKWNRLFQEEEFVRNFWLKEIESNYIGLETRVYNLIALDAKKRYEWLFSNQPHFIKSVPDKYLASMIGIKPRHLSRLRGKK